MAELTAASQERGRILTHVPKKLVIRARTYVGYAGARVRPRHVAIGRGKGLAVVGANGTGKSTFLRAVAGLLEPFAGTIEVLGVPVDERSQRFRSEVATVLDEDSYFPALTLREHLLLTARGHGGTARRRSSPRSWPSSG